MSDPQRCEAKHPRTGHRCHRKRGHERNLREEGYMAWHETEDTAGNTMAWKPTR